MGYETSQELWEEAKKVAESCEKCKKQELNLESEGRAIRYEFCEEHHRELYKKYEEKEEETEEPDKEEMDVPELVEKLEVEIPLAGGSETQKAAKTLSQIGKNNPEEIRPAKSKLMDILLANVSYSIGMAVAACLGIIATYDEETRKKLVELLQHENYFIQQHALHALSEAVKGEPKSVVETRVEHEEDLGKLKQFLPFYSKDTKTLNPISLSIELLSDDETGVRSSTAVFLKENARREPSSLKHFTEEIRSAIEEEESHLEEEIKSNLIVTLGLIGREYFEAVENHMELIRNYYRAESDEVQNAATMALALTSESAELDEDKFRDEVRDLLDPSRYWENTIRDAVYVLGEIGDASDIERIKFIDTPGRYGGTKYTIENAIEKLEEKT